MAVNKHGRMGNCVGNFGADPKIYYKQWNIACKIKTNDWYCESDFKGAVNGQSCEKRQREPRLHQKKRGTEANHRVQIATCARVKDWPAEHSAGAVRADPQMDKANCPSHKQKSETELQNSAVAAHLARDSV